MLDALFITPAVTAVSQALTSARAAEGRLAVIGHPKLATALASPRTTIVPINMPARAAKRLPGVLPDLSTVEARSLDGVVGIDIVEDDAWETTLREWSRCVRDGGVLVFVDKGHAPEASRRALCAGLTEIEQRHVGRTIVTSGLVTHL